MSYEREEKLKKKLKKVMFYKGTGMEQSVLYASMDTQSSFGECTGKGEKKGKIDVCCIEVWRGEQHMADTAFPNM